MFSPFPRSPILSYSIFIYIYIKILYCFTSPSHRISSSVSHICREVIGHTRLIQITSATFGALLVPFHTVTVLPIEAQAWQRGVAGSVRRGGGGMGWDEDISELFPGNYWENSRYFRHLYYLYSDYRLLMGRMVDS